MKNLKFTKENSKINISIDIDDDFSYTLSISKNKRYIFDIKCIYLYDNTEVISSSEINDKELCRLFNRKFPDYPMSIIKSHNTLEIHHRDQENEYTHKIIIVIDNEAGIFDSVFEISKETAIFIEEDGDLAL